MKKNIQLGKKIISFLMIFVELQKIGYEKLTIGG